MGLMVVVPKRVVSLGASGSLGLATWPNGVADEGPKLNTGAVAVDPKVGIEGLVVVAAVAEGAAKLKAPPEVAGLAAAVGVRAGVGFGANDGKAVLGSSNLGVAASGTLVGTGFGCGC